jgi:hypothetical protein
VEAIHAAVAPPFDFASLTELPAEAWASLRFQASGSVTVLHSRYPINTYFQARKDGAEPSIPELEQSCTAIYRRGLSIWRMDLTAPMALVLGSLLDGVPLGDALSLLSSEPLDEAALAEAEQSVLVSFREWAFAGFFSAIA